jgi:hypothetical protein
MEAARLSSQKKLGAAASTLSLSDGLIFAPLKPKQIPSSLLCAGIGHLIELHPGLFSLRDNGAHL